MRKFMDENFLLMNDTAVDLYNQYAKEMPIIDYHCHLDPREIYENKRYSNLTEVWLYGDHYKWRAMRANGVDEKLVTGGEGVTDYDRFMAWAKTVPNTVGNPLYQWSHLELQRIFGINDIINGDNAPQIWEKANSQLTGDGFSVRDLIRKSNVEVVCTTDDPADSLEYHIKLKEDEDLGFQVLPAFRPDKFLEINRSTYLPWIKKLEDASQKKIVAYDQLLDALKSRVEFFNTVGGRVSDHALDYVPYADATLEQASAIFAKALRGESVSLMEEQQYKTYTLIFLGKLYAEHGWAMQFHMNAYRNTSTRMFNELGPDTGYDSMNDSSVAGPLVKLLDALEREKALPRTILYSLNAKDNDVIGAIIGSFQGDGIPGKIQLGAAWWYNDTKTGMLEQMNTLANMGVLSRFVGMLTDSRSFLSYTRHEYFRRILCNLLSEWVEQGEAPNDMEWLGGIVQNICYKNAKAYFRF